MKVVKNEVYFNILEIVKKYNMDFEKEDLFKKEPYAYLKNWNLLCFGRLHGFTIYLEPDRWSIGLTDLDEGVWFYLEEFKRMSINVQNCIEELQKTIKGWKFETPKPQYFGHIPEEVIVLINK